MLKENLLSIVIPTFNSEKTLKKCLESVIDLKSSYNNIELLVIDGASTDKTDEIICSYKKDIDFFISERDKGIYNAMNKGITNSSGGWVYFLGSDDYLNIHKDLFHTIDILSVLLDSNVNVVAGKVLYDNGIFYQSHLNKNLSFKNTIHHQAAFYRKSILVDNGGYDESYHLLADFKMNQTIFLNKKNDFTTDILLIPNLIALCGHQGLSKTQHKQLRLERFTLIKNWYLYLSWKIKNLGNKF